MKTTLMIATVLAAGASAVYAQDPVTQPPAATVPAATTSVPGPAKPAGLSPERQNEVRRRSILVNAMNQGASDLVREMQRIDPGSVITGSVIVSPARARGIELEGYGVLFDVDVPLMNMSVVWTQRQMAVQNVRDRISEARRLRARATSPDEQQPLDARIQMLTISVPVAPPRRQPRGARAASPLTRVAQSAGSPRPRIDRGGDGARAASSRRSRRAAPTRYSDAIKTAR
jgi:hypothetical protein